MQLIEIQPFVFDKELRPYQENGLRDKESSEPKTRIPKASFDRKTMYPRGDLRSSRDRF